MPVLLGYDPLISCDAVCCYGVWCCMQILLVLQGDSTAATAPGGSGTWYCGQPSIAVAASIFCSCMACTQLLQALLFKSLLLPRAITACLSASSRRLWCILRVCPSVQVECKRDDMQARLEAGCAQRPSSHTCVVISDDSVQVRANRSSHVLA